MKNEKIDKFHKWVENVLYILCVTGVQERYKSNTDDKQEHKTKLAELASNLKMKFIQKVRHR